MRITFGRAGPAAQRDTAGSVNARVMRNCRMAGTVAVSAGLVHNLEQAASLYFPLRSAMSTATDAVHIGSMLALGTNSNRRVTKSSG